MLGPPGPAGGAAVSARRLKRFADERGLLFEHEPAARRTPAVFRRYDRQTLVGWFGVPGPTGFEVGQSVRNLTITDETAHTSRITWAAFALRTGDDGARVALRAIAGVLPSGWNAEIDQNELVLWTLRRRTRLTSTRLWTWLEQAHGVLEPLLARSERVSDPAIRRRRGIRLAIEA